MYKNKYLLKFYKFIHNIFKQPMFLNILIFGIFLVSIRFWYMFLIICTTLLKDVQYFYLMFKISIIIGILYLFICYIVVNHYKKDYFNDDLSYFKLNKKFINLNNIYSWVHHKNNIINIILPVLSHFLTVLIHTNIYLHIMLNKIYYHEWWYWYFMICYFLYIIDITFLYLYTYNGFEDYRSINLEWRGDYTYNVNIYKTVSLISIPKYIYNNIDQLISKLTFSEYWWGDNSELIFISELVTIIYNLIGWPWTLILNFNNFVVNILQLKIIYNYDILVIIGYMLSESQNSFCRSYYRCVVANILYLILIVLLLFYMVK